MRLFGWFDLAMLVAATLFALFVLVLRVVGLFHRYEPLPGKKRETWTKWPLWLPHPHDWQDTTLGFQTGTGGGIITVDMCMRCRRKRNERIGGNP